MNGHYVVTVKPSMYIATIPVGDSLAWDPGLPIQITGIQVEYIAPPEDTEGTYTPDDSMGVPGYHYDPPEGE